MNPEVPLDPAMRPQGHFEKFKSALHRILSVSKEDVQREEQREREARQSTRKPRTLRRPA